MPKDDINYNFTDNGIVYSFYDVFVPSEFFNQPTLLGWGYNSLGNLGDFSSTARSTPVTSSTNQTNWKSVSCGYYHVAGLKTDGSIWTFGRNSEGQLGVINTTTRNTPVTTFLGGNDWRSISAASFHTAAVKNDGTLWTWGRSSEGQLGVNTTVTQRNTPVTTQLGGNDWKSVSCGDLHTLAIKTDGTLWSWGLGSSGQIGVANIVQRNTPVTTLAGGTDWRYVASMRGNHSMAIKTDGSLWVWGLNDYGQLGIDDNTNRITPVTTILGGNDWRSVAGGLNHTIALKTDGTLWTWGRNSYGQLGINSVIHRSTPVTTLLGGNNWKSIFSGNFHCLATKTDGTLWNWGWNSDGQLGINESGSPATNRYTPVTTLTGGANWKSAAGGGAFSMAIRIQTQVQ